MSSFSLYLALYLLGGLTFLPIVLGIVLLHAELTLPRQRVVKASSTADQREPLYRSDDGRSVNTTRSATLAKELERGHGPAVAEGYFAVCREYVPGGINGKPPERTTPAGEVVTGESPSLYQSMYRSLFDRKQAPTLEGNKGNTKVTRRARNVFYVVLRHGHLMLYDDSEQVEVRHVISLAHHVVDVYGGGDEIPEGELWIKRNAIRLTRREDVGDQALISKPFYFFCENCSDKEDFYFTLLQNQDRASDGANSPPPQVQRFDVKDIVALVQQLHSSEEYLETRWVNALIGRLFLAMYKSREIENFVRTKITKKISRVKKPAFLSGIALQKIDMGEAAPYITNPRLKDLTVNGDCCVEADVAYDGNFKLEVAATARIDLGARFKVREVNLVLAVVIKRIDGHCLLKFKPPPSNRVWVTFEVMPHMEMTIEPVVSSRQVTYGVILRAIESRIREVVAETLVLPHWDDIPFTSTVHQRFRGGIWATDRDKSRQSLESDSLEAEHREEETVADLANGSEAAATTTPESRTDWSAAITVTGNNLTPHTPSARIHGASFSSVENVEGGTPTGVQERSELPRAIRSRSFVSAADPVLSRDNASIATAQRLGSLKHEKDAASTMIEISNRSQPSSPSETPVGSLNMRSASLSGIENIGPSISDSSLADPVADNKASPLIVTRSTKPSASRSPQTPSSKSTRASLGSSNQPPNSANLDTPTLQPPGVLTTFPSIGAAAAAAKSWGWNTLSRTRGKNEDFLRASNLATTLEHPIGRGRPLPPPGQPLPRPEKRKINPIIALKRKPLSPPLVSERQRAGSKDRDSVMHSLPHRHTAATSEEPQIGDGSLLVVGVPSISEPTSPLDDGYGEFVDNVKLDDDDEASVTASLGTLPSLS